MFVIDPNSQINRNRVNQKQENEKASIRARHSQKYVRG
jgi:hypothetical protein